MLLVIGDANADVAARVPRLPREGDDLPLDELAWSSGGAGVNVATAFARLGGRARLLARVGGDPAAGVALAAATQAGVDLSAVQRDPERATGVCLIMVSANAERTFLSYRGANAFLAAPPASIWEGVRQVHVCGHALLGGRQRDTTVALVAEASRRRLPLSLDLCLPLLRSATADLDLLWPRFDIVFANEVEFHRLVLGETATLPEPGERLDEAAEWLKRRGARTLVVKRGALGSTIVTDARRDIAPFVVGALDTTAAGDAFVAGFLWATAAALAAPISARLANAMGALKAARAGSADVLPSRAELAQFLGEHGATAELAHLESAQSDSMAEPPAEPQPLEGAHPDATAELPPEPPSNERSTQ